ncbi:MAG: DUF1289 domain-containing protein [Woeseiaceae bacterium]
MNKLDSPCIRNCCLNESDICLGCFRSIDEICLWSRATEAEKQNILNLAEARISEYNEKYM